MNSRDNDALTLGEATTHSIFMAQTSRDFAGEDGGVNVGGRNNENFNSLFDTTNDECATGTNRSLTQEELRAESGQQQPVKPVTANSEALQH